MYHSCTIHVPFRRILFATLKICYIAWTYVFLDEIVPMALYCSGAEKPTNVSPVASVNNNALKLTAAQCVHKGKKGVIICSVL